MVTREWRKAKSAKLEFAVVSAFRDNSSFGHNILGPLCLWQCFFKQMHPLGTGIHNNHPFFTAGGNSGNSRKKTIFLPGDVP